MGKKTLAMYFLTFITPFLWARAEIGLAGVKVSSHIVLFKNYVESVVNRDGKAARQVQLQRSTTQNIEKLKAFLANRSLREPEIESLWLVNGGALDLDEAEVEALRQQPWVAKVLRNKKRRGIDPKASSFTEDGVLPWGLDAVGLREVRENFPLITGRGVRVGVLDTGIQSRHPEFAATSEIKFKDAVNGLKSPYDDHGHGTHVSATIAGIEVGIAPEASLYVAKIFSAGGSAFDTWIIDGMQWIYDPDGNPETDDGPQVVNNSWGMGVEQGVYDIDEFMLFHRAVKAWVAGGLIPIFAAGNSGTEPNGIPGGFAEVISVGALDQQGQVAEFSSRGPNFWLIDGYILSLLKPDFSAPGVDTLSAVPPNEYAFMSGTSMATPHMVGALALALQTQPDLDAAAAKSLLLASVQPKGDTGYGHGSLDLFRMIKVQKP